MTLSKNNIASGNVLIDALLKARRYDLATATGGNITYRFVPSSNHYQSVTNYLNGAGMPLDMTAVPAGSTAADALLATFAMPTSSLQSTINAVLAGQFSSLTDLSFTTTSTSQAANYYTSAADNRQDGVDMSIGMASLTTGGFGIQPNDGRRGGDVWFDTNPNRFGNAGDANGITRGENDYRVVLHEIGHSLGLRHPHAGETGSAVPAAVLPTAWDSMEFTVMTYRMYVGGPASLSSPNDVEAHSFAQSLMMLDIQALQYMYGADFTTRAGSTAYTFDPTTGEMYIDGVGQGRPGGPATPSGSLANRILLTIWDGGGSDTYDFANYSTNLKVNLAPGGFTNLGTQLAQLAGASTPLNALDDKYARGNIFNALQYHGDARSLIENAKGGSGNDTILGNAADNVLKGNDGTDSLVGGTGGDTLNGDAGLDTLVGGTGNDGLYGGAGADSMIGGAGDDSYQVDAAGDKVVELLGEGRDSVVVLGALAAYTLTANTETLSFLGYDQAGIRTAAARTGTGNALANSMTSFYDSATLVGGLGNDTLQGSVLADSLVGGDGDDILKSGGARDTMSGGAGSDRIVFAGLDTGGDADGGLGNDTLDLSGLSDVTRRAFVDLEQPTWSPFLFQSGYGGSLSGIENVHGGAGRDLLYGTASANVLDGGGNTDYLEGRGGNDTYFVDNLGDTVVEAAGAAGGIDTVVLMSSATYTLADNVENLRANAAGVLFGNALANSIRGSADADVLGGGLDARADTLVGGLGDDIYDISDLLDVLVENVGAGRDTVRVTLASPQTYTLLANFETLVFSTEGNFPFTNLNGTGNALDNGIRGNAGNNILRGLAGKDTISGGDGADTLYGGGGIDQLTGGLLGADVFAFNTELAGSADVVTDFEVGTDKLWLDDAVMAGIRNAASTLDAAQFVNLRNAGAAIVGATRIYEDAAGALFYDRDGSGAALGVKVADLGAASLTAADIKVI